MRFAFIILIVAAATIAVAFLTLSKDAPTTNTNTASSSVANETPYYNIPDDWTSCVNTKHGFKFTYPSEWHNLAHGQGEAVLTTCQEQEGADVLIFSPKIPSESDKQTESINVDVSDQGRLSTTVYAGAQSVDEYFSKNPLLLKDLRIVKETSLDGERLVWREDGFVLVFHNGTMFGFRFDNLGAETRDYFLANFNFVEGD